MEDTSIKVVIVDDHPVVRKGIESFIEDEDGITIVGEAANTRDALSVLQSTMPDIAVVDISLSESSSGLDLIKIMRSKFPRIKVLVLSMFDEALYAERAQSLGARGYIQKNKGPKMIVDAIKEIHAGGTFFENVPARPHDDQGKLVLDALSDREFEVFQLYGEGLDTVKIAQKLKLSKYTVDSHRRNIKIKLKIPNNNALVMIATQWVLDNVKKVY